MSSRQLFGTDGVRGRAGHFLTADLALALARAAVTRTGTPHPQVLIVRDTRESGEMLEAAIAAGVTAAGGDALLAGVLPTPAAPLLVRRHGLTLAAVISASHNPYEDNGIKLFAADGFKLDDDTEHAIEAELDNEPPVPTRIGRVRRFHGALEDYLRELHVRFADLDLSGRRVLLDCANGATFRAAPEIFRRLGADVDVLADQPDGRNINDGCGSTHIDPVRERMTSGDYDVGFAFDGDGDRVLAVDSSGAIVDGDELIALAAIHLQRRNRLPGQGVAVTVMTNYGFHTAMAAAGIHVATTPVGDRYVLDELRRRGWSLGGEQSGHIIDLGFGPSGDGIASALLTLEALGTGDLHTRGAMQKLPQRLENVRAQDRATLDAAMSHSSVQSAIAREDEALSGRGRVLVRASGTEPLIRVMVEAPSAEETEQVCARLTDAVRQAIEPGKDGA
ncbi:MAG TPA: phosphoglucosamine mutase [Solirubrobacteraceae bacterium]|jgi:phosphoglucosamine mutase|nr:phosphoglucosamine mutase [Solirubrobacteraceae bacterium]